MIANNTIATTPIVRSSPDDRVAAALVTPSAGLAETPAMFCAAAGGLPSPVAGATTPGCEGRSTDAAGAPGAPAAARAPAGAGDSPQFGGNVKKYAAIPLPEGWGSPLAPEATPAGVPDPEPLPAPP